MTPHLYLLAFDQVEANSLYLRALHMELKNEPRCSETAEGVWQDPGRNQTGTDQRRDAHGAPSANPLRQVSDDSTTDAGSSLHQDAGNRSYPVVFALLRSQEGSVAVL